MEVIKRVIIVVDNKAMVNNIREEVITLTIMVDSTIINLAIDNKTTSLEEVAKFKLVSAVPHNFVKADCQYNVPNALRQLLSIEVLDLMVIALLKLMDFL